MWTGSPCGRVGQGQDLRATHCGLFAFGSSSRSCSACRCLLTDIGLSGGQVERQRCPRVLQSFGVRCEITQLRQGPGWDGEFREELLEQTPLLMGIGVEKRVVGLGQGLTVISEREQSFTLTGCIWLVSGFSHLISFNPVSIFL